MTTEQCPHCGAHRGLNAHSHSASDEKICNRCYNDELLKLLLDSHALPLHAAVS